MLLPSNRHLSEVRLIVNDSSNKGSGRFGFVDIFVNDYKKNRAIVIELKHISLQGLLSGEREHRIKNPEYKQLSILDGKIESEQSNKLLARYYMFWSSKENKYVKCKLMDLVDEAKQQTKTYIRTLKNGVAIRNICNGVCCDKINVINENGKIGGFLIISIG